MLKSLLWKEWHESRWKLATLAALFLVLTALSLILEHNRPGGQSQTTLIILVLIMPGVVAMSTIADERVRRTADTLRVLPVSNATVFLVKSLAGLATLLVPLALAYTCRFLLQPTINYPNTPSINSPVVTCALFGLPISLYLWTLHLAARRRSELGVAATYILLFAVLAIMGVLFALVRTLLWRIPGFTPGAAAKMEAIFMWLYSASPVGFAVPLNVSEYEAHRWAFAIIALQLSSWVILWPLALRRQNHTSLLRVARPLDQPAISPKTAFTSLQNPIFWKSWRESRPLVLIYLIAATALILLASIVNQADLALGWSFGLGTLFLVGPSTFFAMVVTILLGVDVGMRESDTHLETFWKSRPIPSTHYFRQRFNHGLLFSLLVLIAPLALTLLITSIQLSAMGFSEDLPRTPTTNVLFDLSEVREYAFACLLFLTPEVILFYSFSVFLATLFRRRLIPLLVSIGFVLFLETFCPTMFLVLALLKNWPLVVMYLILILPGCLLFPWLAAKSTAADWRARLERKSEASFTLAKS